MERWESLKKTTSKILKPFTSLWSKIWGFLSKVLLGNFLLKLIDYFANPKNQSKLTNIFRFLKDWWPPLLASYILFGTSFGRMATALVATIAKSTLRLVTYLIPLLATAIKKVAAMKVGKMLMGLLGGAKLKGLTGLFSLGAGAFAGGGLVQKFAEGGKVSGPGGVDKVPAKLTAGEFVMSKGAVQKFGVDTMEGMNAAGGGTNVPTIGGLPGLGGGGGGTDSLTEQAKVKTFGSALGDFFSGDDGSSRYMTDLEKSQRMVGGGLVQHFEGGGQVDDGIGSIDWNHRTNRDLAQYPDKRLISPATLLKGAEVSVYDEMGKWKGTIIGDPLKGTKMEKFQARKAALQEKVEIKEAIEAEKNINKPSLNIAPTKTKTTEVKPPGVNNVVKNYMAEKANSDVQNNANKGPVSGGEGTGIPEFDAEKYVSEQKLKTLGIT